MDPEEFVSPEVGIAVAATTVVLHPKVRATVRRGLVLGLAGGLMAWDGLRAFAAEFNPGPGASGMKEVANDALDDIKHDVQSARGQGKSVTRKSKGTDAP